MTLKLIEYYIFINALIALNINGQDTIQQIVYNPIGIFHSPYTPQTGAPRQGILRQGR